MERIFSEIFLISNFQTAKLLYQIETQIAY